MSPAMAQQFKAYLEKFRDQSPEQKVQIYLRELITSAELLDDPAVKLWSEALTALFNREEP